MSDAGIGKLIEGESNRDAIHVAIAPVVANEMLRPGEAVGFIEDGNTSLVGRKVDGLIGIVDPYLKEPVLKNDSFWLFLYPNTVTGMRHHWSHPAFTENKPTQTDKAGGIIEKTAAEFGLVYVEFMDYVRDYLRTGESACDGGRWEGQSLWGNDEFWNAYEEVTGTKVPEDDRGGVFSCSC